MKKAIALLLVLVTLLSLTACAGKEDTASSALDQIKQKGELVVGTSADYPPYEFHTEVDGKDTIVGFDMEIAQAIADKLGVSLKIVDMSFDNLLMSLANDEFDLVIAGLSADEERRKTTDFSDPYLEAKNLILVRAEDADKYASLDDLKGAKGGAQTGSKPYNNCVTYCGEETTVGLAKLHDQILHLGKTDRGLLAAVGNAVVIRFGAGGRKAGCCISGLYDRAVLCGRQGGSGRRGSWHPRDQ